MKLLQILVDNAICPKLIRRGRHIILIEIPEFGIRFVSSHNYLKGNEYDLAKQFNINCNRYYLPEKLLTRNRLNLNFNLNSKNDKFYFDLESNESDYNDYLNLVRECEDNFQTTICFYFDQRLQILISAIACFLKECFTFQLKLKTKLKNCNVQFLVNPFNSPMCSLSSFVFVIS